MPAEPRITLLGPQRDPRLPQVVRARGLRSGRFAMVTAGWRDRENDDTLLSELLGGRTVNLQLWTRMQQLWEEDPELDAADRERRRVLTELQELYVIGLQQSVEAVHRITEHRPRVPAVREAALEDVLSILRSLDERHLERVNDVHQTFYERYQPQHRPAVVRGRFAVGQLIAGCDAVVIPGGHVGVLLGALHLFNLGPALGYVHEEEQPDGSVVGSPRVYRPVIAWGAGAMALTERVFLFHDFSVVAPGISELLMEGLCLTKGLIALPSAKDRLDLRDLPSTRSLVLRSAPLVPVLLDVGTQVVLGEDGRLPAGARVLGPDGRARKLAPEDPGGPQGAGEPQDDEPAPDQEEPA